jgi:hypothetical protein
MPVYHHGDPAEGSLNLFGEDKPSVKKSRLQKAEDATIKRQILAKFREGEHVADPRTGAIAVVDASAPRGLRPLWKAVNAHNHKGAFTLGVDDISKGRLGKSYDGPEYGDLSGTKSDVTKRRDDRPANKNSRI